MVKGKCEVPLQQQLQKKYPYNLYMKKQYHYKYMIMTYRLGSDSLNESDLLVPIEEPVHCILHSQQQVLHGGKSAA